MDYLRLGIQVNTAMVTATYNGLTWLEADYPPGPLLPQGILPQFKFTVTNTGEVPLTDIIVTDNVLGQIGHLTTLAPGASYDFFV